MKIDVQDCMGLEMRIGKSVSAIVINKMRTDQISLRSVSARSQVTMLTLCHDREKVLIQVALL